MKKVNKNVVMWILSIFMLLAALIYLPSFASIIMFVFAVIAAPIPKLQQFFAGKGLRGKVKVILLIVLFFVSLALVPAATSDDGDSPETASLVEAEAVPVEPAAEDTLSPEPSNETTADPTPTEAPSPSPVSTPTLDPTPDPTPTPTPTPEDVTPEYKYVGSVESNKYHDFTCRHVENINENNKIYFYSKEDAAAQNYEPCGTCQ